ncbi:hypothetical protein HCUR_00774 [Holospora curviuscula]|uniref:Uncharacterized protein n=1 Tax=Holospora curviuscula TaxID=1082868 RepID=A0A2S5R8V5_9PROT|nr:hypothetical protein HCUR_00774 [Holospora curviuscula]
MPPATLVQVDKSSMGMAIFKDREGDKKRETGS